MVANMLLHILLFRSDSYPSRPGHYQWLVPNRACNTIHHRNLHIWSTEVAFLPSRRYPYDKKYRYPPFCSGSLGNKCSIQLCGSSSDIFRTRARPLSRIWFCLFSHTFLVLCRRPFVGEFWACGSITHRRGSLLDISVSNHLQHLCSLIYSEGNKPIPVFLMY